MRKTFFAGLATLLPIAITLFIITFVVDLVTDPFIGIIKHLLLRYEYIFFEKHQYLFIFLCRLLVLIGFVLLIFLLGFVGRRIMFSWIMKIGDRLIKKIPIVKTIYRICKDISTNMFTKDKKSFFKGTVAVPFPHEKTLALGFLSGNAPEEVREKKGEELQSVFIPTAPHPISGFLLMYSPHEVKALDIKTEDLFKFLVSCGIYHPDEQSKKPSSGRDI